MIRKMLRASVLIVSVFLVCNTGMVYAQQLVTDGLVSYWSFNKSHIAGNTVKDLKGGNDGTIVGAPEIVPGKVNEALSLNDGRAGDHIDVADSPELHTTEALTICLWINFRSTQAPNNWPCIIRKGHSSGANYFFGLWDLTSQVYMTFTPPWQDKQSGLNLNQENWIYIALRVSGPDQTVSFYIDGQTSEKPLGFDALPDTDADIMIGGGVPADAADLNATIDELCIYNRALSDDEIEQNLAATQGLAIENESSLIHTWGAIKASI